MKRQAAVCFVQVDDEVLILLRAEREGRFVGWCLPGGKLEPDETALAACIRETDEETSIKVYDPVYVGTHVSGSGDFDVSIYYKLLISKPEVTTVPREHSKHVWAKMSELDGFVLSGNTAKFIDMVTAFIAK